MLPARLMRNESALGRYFAELAHLESAAVVAFAILERELALHGAPDKLLQAARKAMGDEVRHAEIMARLARHFSASPAPVELRKRAKRRLLEIALENAVEGCVRGSYGALLAHHQATMAEAPEVRSAWTTIAPEKSEHAALAHEVHRWLLTKLMEDERAEVAAALREALESLRSEISAEPDPELVSAAGLPDAARAKALLDEIERELSARATRDTRPDHPAVRA